MNFFFQNIVADDVDDDFDVEEGMNKLEMNQLVLMMMMMVLLMMILFLPYLFMIKKRLLTGCI